jgi:hypothetical protein
VTIILTVVAVVLCLALALAAVVLLVPIRVVGRGVFTEQRVDAQLSAAWMWGMVALRASPDEGVALRLLGLRVYRLRTRPEAGPEPRERKQKRRRRDLPAWGIGVRSVRSLRLRARASGRLGTGDPADTVFVFGVVAMLRSLFPRIDMRGLHIDWLEPAIDLDVQVEGWVWLAAIGWIVVSEYIGSRWPRRRVQEVPA